MSTVPTNILIRPPVFGSSLRGLRSAYFSFNSDPAIKCNTRFFGTIRKASFCLDNLIHRRTSPSSYLYIPEFPAYPGDGRKFFSNPTLKTYFPSRAFKIFIWSFSHVQGNYSVVCHNERDIFRPEIIVMTTEKSISHARLHGHYEDFSKEIKHL